MINATHNVPSNIADAVEKWVTGTKIPWFFFNHTLGDDPKGQIPVQQDKYLIKDMPRFTHYFYPNSKTANEDRAAVMPLTEWVRKQLLPGYQAMRVMGNLTMQTPNASSYLNLPHVDSNNKNVFSFLYYVNTSDGNTVFFKDGQIDFETRPVKGTGVLFRSNTVHAGQIPSINKTRYVINIVFSKRD